MSEPEEPTRPTQIKAWEVLTPFDAVAFFDITTNASSAEDRLFAFLEDTLEVEDLPCEDVTHDYYDMSFELRGVPDEFRWPGDKLRPIWEVGFERFWLCHTDGMETFYYKGGSVEGHHHPGHELRITRE